MRFWTTFEPFDLSLVQKAVKSEPIAIQLRVFLKKEFSQRPESSMPVCIRVESANIETVSIR